MKSKINITLLFITLGSSIGYFLFSILKGNYLYNIEDIIGAFILLVLMGLFVVYTLRKKERRTSPFIGISSILLTSFFTLNLLIGFHIIKLPEEKVVGSFVNENIKTALEWAKDNKIEVAQIYENSDTFPEYSIISQNIKVGTSVSKIKKIEFIISSGPSYDKMVIIPNMIGMEADDVLKFILDNHLINVSTEFVTSESPKDTVISQDKNGEQRRDAEIKLVLSIGPSNDLGEITMVDLKNKSLTEALFFLKRNGLAYKLNYEFSDSISKNYVISQSVKEGSKVTSENTIAISVSKGKEIKAPNFLTMTANEITNWVIENKCKISFQETYDETIALGKIISVNYKEGDTIEEGSTIVVTTSKGQLKVPAVSTISELRSWASSNNIRLEESYNFHDSLSNGSIISMTPTTGDTIKNGGSISVNISQGKAVTIPNFIGKSKSAITSTCKSLGLNCTFSYTTYSSSAKDIALSQNKTAGSTVISGTYVSIGLSKGPATTFTIEISESQLTIGNADKTISTLRTWFSSKYSGVTFTFVKKPSVTYGNAGFIHENSPIKDNSKVTQGNSYQVWITE